jgi:hypothetical protein
MDSCPRIYASPLPPRTLYNTFFSEWTLRNFDPSENGTFRIVNCHRSLKLNINKCKIVSYGRQRLSANNYSINSVDLDHLTNISDLGVNFDSRLNFSGHINDEINKANSILGIIKINFKYVSQKALVLLYKPLIRSHL